MQFRSTGKSDNWHFCRNCSRWPERDFDVLAILPPDLPLCEECIALRDRDECRQSGHGSRSQGLPHDEK